MRLVIFQTLTVWLLTGAGFWGGFVALGLRFSAVRPDPVRHTGIAA